MQKDREAEGRGGQAWSVCDEGLGRRQIGRRTTTKRDWNSVRLKILRARGRGASFEAQRKTSGSNSPDMVGKRGACAMGDMAEAENPTWRKALSERAEGSV